MSILNSNMHVTTVSTQGSDQSKPAVKPQPSVASSFAEVLQQTQEPKAAQESAALKESMEKTDEPARNVVDEFMAWMQMSPAEKIRDRMLKEMGLTEEELKELDPEEQEKIEALIAQKIRDELELKTMNSALG